MKSYKQLLEDAEGFSSQDPVMDLASYLSKNLKTKDEQAIQRLIAGFLAKHNFDIVPINGMIDSNGQI